MGKSVCRLLLLFLGISSCKAFQYHTLLPGYYVLDVEAFCNLEPTGDMEIMVITDLNVAVTAFCKNNYTVDVDSYDNTHFWFYPVFTGDPDTECVFDKKVDSETYTLYVETLWGEPETKVRPVVQTYIVTCTYDDHSQNTTNIELIGDSLIAPTEIQNHQGVATTSTITLRLVDALENNITGTIPKGKLVKLRGLSDGSGGEVGLHAVACDAVGDNGVRFAILRAGCGDGIIFNQSAGFVTNGLDVSSPYFPVFSLKGSNSMQFHCNFTVCPQNCDGSSCRDDVIDKRSAHESSIMTASEGVSISQDGQLASSDDVQYTGINYHQKQKTDSTLVENAQTPWWHPPLAVLTVTSILMAVLAINAINLHRQRRGSHSINDGPAQGGA